MSKTLKALIVGMLAVGCASTPTMKSVAGTYELKEDGDTRRMILLDNGIAEGYTNGKKEGKEAKWKIVDGDIHVGLTGKGTGVFSINKDGSITMIARIDALGKREEAPKEEQFTLKKIK